MPRPTTVSLVLGSGGARGYAHIGAIRELEQRGFQVAAIAGSSMGALVGGLYAAGKLEAFADWALTLRRVDILRLLDVSLLSPGVIRAERIMDRVRELVGDTAIEDLPVPFTAVATELDAGHEVWLQRGSLASAIRASIALPGVFAPVVLDGRLLVDGGLMDPLPVAPTAAVATDLTVAIWPGGEREGAPESVLADQTADEAGVLEGLAQSLRARFGGKADAGDEPGDETAEPGWAQGAPPPGLGIFDVMQRSLDAMQGVVMRYRIAGFPADVLVSVPRDACASLDFHEAEAMIALGEKLTGEALDESERLAAR